MTAIVLSVLLITIPIDVQEAHTGYMQLITKCTKGSHACK